MSGPTCSLASSTNQALRHPLAFSLTSSLIIYLILSPQAFVYIKARYPQLFLPRNPVPDYMPLAGRRVRTACHPKADCPPRDFRIRGTLWIMGYALLRKKHALMFLRSFRQYYFKRCFCSGCYCLAAFAVNMLSI